MRDGFDQGISSAGRLGLLLVAVLALAAIGCDSTPRPSGSAAPGPTSAAQASGAAGPIDCAARIAAVDLASEATVVAVDACRFTLAGRNAALSALAGHPSGGALWAAVWIYATAGRDPAPLLPVLQSTDASARAMAAAALVGFGEPSGFEPLRLALADDTTLNGSEPPMSIRTFAVAALEGSIVADPLPVDGAGWSGWLVANATKLAFDADAGTWSLP